MALARRAPCLAHKEKEKRLLAALCARTNCTTYEKDLSDGVTQEKALEAYNSVRGNYGSLEEMREALSLEHRTLGDEYNKSALFAYNSYSQTRDDYIDQGDADRLKALDRRFRPDGLQFEKNRRDAEAVERHEQAVAQNRQDYDSGKISGREYLSNAATYWIESSSYNRDLYPPELDAEYLKLVEKNPEIAQQVATIIQTTDKVVTAAGLANLTRGLAALGKGGVKALFKGLFKPRGNQNYKSLKPNEVDKTGNATNNLPSPKTNKLPEAKITSSGETTLVRKEIGAPNTAVKPISILPDVKTWNQFQAATKGKFVTRADAAKGWNLYKQANSVQAGAKRSQAAKSFFLTQLQASGKTPKWMNQWLSKGKVPPGYQVDHIKPLSINGADSPVNMRLLDIQTHKTHHKIFAPWKN